MHDAYQNIAYHFRVMKGRRSIRERLRSGPKATSSNIYPIKFVLNINKTSEISAAHKIPRGWKLLATWFPNKSPPETPVHHKGYGSGANAMRRLDN